MIGWLRSPRAQWVAIGLCLAIGIALDAMYMSVLGQEFGWPIAIARESARMTAVVAGVLAWIARPSSPIGRLFAIGSVLEMLPEGAFQTHNQTLFVIGMLAINLHNIPQMWAALTFPTGRLSGRAEVIGMTGWCLWASVISASFIFVPISGCPRCRAGLDPLASSGTGWITLLYYVSTPLAIIWAGWIVYRKWKRSTGPGRRIVGPVLTAIIIVTATALVENVLWGVYGIKSFPMALSSDVPLAARVTTIAANWTTGLAGFVFLVGVLRTRVTRSSVGDLMVKLTSAPSPDEIRDAVADALGDATLRIGYADGDAFIDGSGSVLEIPDGRGAFVIETDQGPLAVFDHDPVLVHEDRLLTAVAGAAHLTLENQRLNALVRNELAVSRQARRDTVAASDRERNRIERDLHDGAQQRLVGIALALRMAQLSLPTEAARAGVGRAVAEAQEALAELRDLSHGLNTTRLENEGLTAALQDLAEHARHPVLVHGALPSLPLESEHALFRVITEVVGRVDGATNIRLSSGAGRAEVTIDGPVVLDGETVLGLVDRLNVVDGALTTTPDGLRIALPISVVAVAAS